MSNSTLIVWYVFMNYQIKSHRQTVELNATESTLTMQTPFENGRPKVLKPVSSLHISRKLLQSNKDSERFIGNEKPHSLDPFGKVLRFLRVQQGVESSVIATEACISIWQLYQLETGEDTLFYTPGLRLKAAERVASLLGSNWSDIVHGAVTIDSLKRSKSKVHVLKTVLTKTSLRPVHTDPLAETSGFSDGQESIVRDGGDDGYISTAFFLHVRND